MDRSSDRPEGPSSNANDLDPSGPSSNVVDPIADPIADPIVDPIVDRIAEPSAGPSAEPSAGPTAEPSAGPTAEPAAGPTADPHWRHPQTRKADWACQTPGTSQWPGREYPFHPPREIGEAGIFHASPAANVNVWDKWYGPTHSRSQGRIFFGQRSKSVFTRTTTTTTPTRRATATLTRTVYYTSYFSCSNESRLRRIFCAQYNAYLFDNPSPQVRPTRTCSTTLLSPQVRPVQRVPVRQPRRPRAAPLLAAAQSKGLLPAVQKIVGSNLRVRIRGIFGWDTCVHGFFQLNVDVSFCRGCGSATWSSPF